MQNQEEVNGHGSAVGIFFLFLYGFVPGLIGLALYFGVRGERVQATA